MSEPLVPPMAGSQATRTDRRFRCALPSDAELLECKQRLRRDARAKYHGLVDDLSIIDGLVDRVVTQHLAQGFANKFRRGGMPLDCDVAAACRAGPDSSVWRGFAIHLLALVYDELVEGPDTHLRPAVLNPYPSDADVVLQSFPTQAPTPDVLRSAFGQLVDEMRPVEFRVMVVYLRICEECRQTRGSGATLPRGWPHDVAKAAQTTVDVVNSTILRFANRLSRMT